MSSTEELKNALLRAFESHAALIELDLGGVTFIDSTGIRLVLWAANRSRENGARLRIDCGGAVRRLLELTQLDRSLPLA